MSYKLIKSLLTLPTYKDKMDLSHRHFYKLIALIGLMFSNQSIAQHFFTSVLKNTVSQSERTYRNDFFISHKLNEQTLLFHSRFDDKTGIYAYNVETGTRSKIIDAPLNIDLEYLHFTGGDGRALVDILGRLYVTDGTQEGTNFIGDFGFTDIGNVTSTFVSSVFPKHYSNGQFFFYEHDFGFPSISKSRIWRTNGTQTGTREVKTDAGLKVLKILDSPDGQGAVVFANSPEKGKGFWKIDSLSNALTEIISFEKGPTPRDIRVSSGTRVRRGLVFCREEYTEQDYNASLWRLSLNGTLVRLTEGCSSDQVAVGESVYFFKGVSELWRSNGSVAGTTKHIDLYPNSAGIRTRRASLCALENSLFVSFMRERERFNDLGTQVWQVLTVEPEAEPIDADYLVACLDKLVAVGRGRGHTEFFKPSANGSLGGQAIKTYGLSGEFPNSGATGLDEIQSNYIWEMNEDVYLFNSWSDFSNENGGSDMPSFGTRVVHFEFKQTQFNGYLPAALMLLED